MTRKQKDIRYIKISQNTEQFQTEHLIIINATLVKKKKQQTTIVNLPSFKIRVRFMKINSSCFLEVKHVKYNLKYIYHSNKKSRVDLIFLR